MFPNRRLFSAILIVGFLFAINVSGYAAVTGATVAATNDVGSGFPLWYQDAKGVRLQACLDSKGSNCTLRADNFFDPAKALAFPTNFPDEFFYFVADSQAIATQGCPAAGIAPGTASVRLALEGAFLNSSGTPVAGDQIVFGRVRIVVNAGLCPNAQYQFVHPYGTDTLTTDASGSVAANVGTRDIGCASIPCDFKQAAGSQIFGGFLKWDPAVAPAAPPGYLGDATQLHPVVGGVNNSFQIVDPATGATVAQTNLFTVSGKLAGPLLVSPTTFDFGGQNLNTGSNPTTITIANVDPSANGIAITASSLAGTDASDFAIVSDGCAGKTLVQDTTCSIQVRFTPTVAVRRNGQLQIAYTGGLRSPQVVALTGTGINSGTPVASLPTAKLDFGSTRVRTTTAAQTVTLTNDSSATAPLGATLAISGAGSSQFTMSDTCSGKFLDAGTSCTVAVKFSPTVSASVSASLDLTYNYNAADGRPKQDHVALTGTGTGGVAAVASQVDPKNGFPLWYEDENAVKLQPCLNASDPNCVVPPDKTFNSNFPLVFPTNFPGEFTYFAANSADVATPGCAGRPAGTAFIRVAVVGTFANGIPKADAQIVSGRIGFVVSGGLCPNTRYLFTHPYGTDTMVTDAAGRIPPSEATENIGCAGALCDFSSALSSRIFGGFLKWDPAVAPAAPDGYLGNATSLHKVVGSQYTPPGESSPANFFRIAEADTGKLVARTDQFKIAAKLVGATPPVANNDSASSDGKPVDIDVLANDTDPGGNKPLTVQTLNQPSNGNVAITGNLVTYTPNAGFAGTDTFTYQAANSLGAASNAATVTVTVSPATAITISAPAVTSPNDAVVTVSVSSPSGSPTGNVSLTVDGGTPLTAALSAGVATFTISKPAVGNHTLSANYAAQTNFAADTATGSLTVNAATIAATAIAIAAPVTASPGNATVTVSVSSTAGTPSGSVSLSMDGGPSLTQILAGGRSTFTFASPGIGSHTLSTSYEAQNNFGASNTTGILTVNAPPPATTSITIAAPPVAAPTNGLVTVTVSSADATPTGNVSLIVDASPAISQGLASGHTTFTVSNSGVGTHTLTVRYTAQGNFAASTATGTLVVNAPPIASTTMTIAAPTVTSPSNGLVSVMVSASGGTPTGSVLLSVDGSAPLTQMLSGGQSTFILNNPGVGTHMLNATYAGQASFSGASATGTFTVNAPPIAPTAIIIAAPAISSPASGTVLVAVSSSSGVPTGAVALSIDGGAPILQALAGGQSAFTFFNPAVGNHTLSASYAEQGNFGESVASGMLMVNPPLQSATTTTIATSTVTWPANVVIPVMVTSASGTPSGTVSLSVDGGAPVVQNLVAGKSTFALTSAGVGSHTVNANYVAQGNYIASNAASTFTVNRAATLMTVSAPTVNSPANGTVTVTVTSASGTPSGDISLSVDGGAATSLPLVGGKATFTLTAPSVGNHNLQASYAMHDNFTASDATGTLGVNSAQAAPDVIVTASPKNPYHAASLSYSFELAAGAPDDASAECMLSPKESVFTRCVSPKVYGTETAPLPVGTYTFHVRSLLNGSSGLPASSASVAVERAPVTATASPSAGKENKARTEILTGMKQISVSLENR